MSQLLSLHAWHCKFNVIGSGLQRESAHAAHCTLMLKSQINIELFEDDD